MSYAQPAGGRIPPEFQQLFESLGEAVVIHRLTRFEDRAQRDAALEWLRQREAARRKMRDDEERLEEQRDRRRLIMLVAGMALTSAAAALAFILL